MGWGAQGQWPEEAGTDHWPTLPTPGDPLPQNGDKLLPLPLLLLPHQQAEPALHV